MIDNLDNKIEESGWTLHSRGTTTPSISENDALFQRGDEPEMLPSRHA